MRREASPPRFGGLEKIFLAVLGLVLAAAFALAVHRHIVEERTRSVTLAVNVDDYLDLLARDGVPFERGFDALLQIGVHAVATGGATIDSLERRGAIDVASARDLHKFRRMSGAFPELILNPPGLFADLPPGGMAILSADADLLARLELALGSIAGRRAARLVPAPVEPSGGTLAVLLVPDAGEALRRTPLLEDADLVALLRRMGFRVLHDLNAHDEPPPLEIRGNLARSVERDALAGVMLSAPRRHGARGGEAWLAAMTARPEGFPGAVVMIEGRARTSPLSFPPWVRRVAASLESARQMRSFAEPVDRFLAGGSRTLLLPVRDLGFDRFREEGLAFAAKLRAAGHNLGERKGTTPLGPPTGAFLALLFLLTLACFATLRARLAPGPLVLALHVVLLVALVPLLPVLDRMDLVVPFKTPLAYAVALLFAALPFLVERLHRFPARGGAGIVTPLFQTLSTAVWFFVLLPLPLALLYDPFHLALPPLAGPRTPLLALVALATLASPLYSRRARSLVSARLLDRPLTARGLLSAVAALLLLALLIALGAKGSACGAASWWRGAAEALVGVPLLALYFGARRDSRLRASWLLSPLAAVACAGPALDIVMDPAAPALLSLSASLRAFAFGLAATVAYAAFAGRLFRAAARRGEARA